MLTGTRKNRSDREVQVAVSGPIFQSFTYLVPNRLGQLTPGQRLLVPFRNSTKVGFYLGPTIKSSADKSSKKIRRYRLREVIRVVDQQSYFTSELFRFCIWISEYYFSNPADVLKTALPPAMRSRKKPRLVWADGAIEPTGSAVSEFRPGKSLPAELASTLSRTGKLTQLLRDGIVVERWPEISSDQKRPLIGYVALDTERWQTYFSGKKHRHEPFGGTRTRADLLEHGWSDYSVRTAVKDGIIKPVYGSWLDPLFELVQPRNDVRNISLNVEQAKAVTELISSVDKGFAPYLLHGITGSGKTLVYCHVVQEIIDKGRTALILTPEIILAGTLLAYFRSFFGDNVTVLHSGMSDSERQESFDGIKRGKFKIVIGPRSALFAPLENMGIIIVDEEHDGSYKQDDPAPRFHGRDCAVVRAKLNKIPIVLGSASPSLESYHNAVSGRYRLIELTRRPGSARLPKVEVVDMRRDRLRGDTSFLSFTFKKRLEETIDSGHQAIVFLNRRGFSPYIKCRNCGLVPACKNCQVRLTFHKSARRMTCHYCGYSISNWDECPQCRNSDFHHFGAGTQRVEETLPRLLSKVSAVRLDSDSASGRNRAFEILDEFSSGRSNLLLGTQMVTKGLDLPGVRLVGVISADSTLDMPDFRAGEKTFSLLLQVAGRSGRADKSGEVIIQTFYPDNPLIIDAARQDYRSFYQREISSRKKLGYPPFTRLVNLTLSAAGESELEKAIAEFKSDLCQRVKAVGLKAEILGPASAPLYRLRSRYRRHILIKTVAVVKFVSMLIAWEREQPRFGLNSSIRITIDVDPVDMM